MMISTSLNRQLFAVTLILLSGLGLQSLSAQNEYDAAKKIGIPSPTAASLGKYGDIPVSLYTGVANISIPLYEVKEGPLTLPLSLSYHASGIKPDEIPGWVGSGFSLFSGGVITRVVSGLPDDFEGTYLSADNIDQTSPIVAKGYGIAEQGKNFDPCVSGYPDLQNKPCGCANLPCSTNQTYYDIYDKYRQGKVDLQPDQFSFNFNNSSGKFYYGQDQQIHLAPYQALRIKPYFAGRGIPAPGANIQQAAWGNNYISKWEITTADGTTYIFDAIEISTQIFGTNAGTNRSGTFYNENGSNPAYVSSWFLTKIISPNKNYEINLTYEQKGLQKQHFRSQSWGKYYVGSATGCSAGNTVANAAINVNSAYTIYLKTITTALVSPTGTTATGNTRIEFMHSQRNDLNQTNAYKLDEIQIYHESKLRKKYLFQYQDVAGKRLRLEKVQEKSADPAASPNSNPPPYVFEYNTIALPEYHSNKTDHWGYFNDAANTSDANSEENPYNLILLPAVQLQQSEVPRGYDGALQLDGANREPNGEKMQAGVLTKITYPTGGTTSLLYQAHEYNDNGTARMVGGLRIWKMISAGNSDANKNVEKEYLYTLQGTTTSSGIYGGVKPKYHWPINISGSNNTDYYSAFIRESGMLYPLLYTQGSHISYSEVTEKRSDGSKTRFTYSNFSDFPDIAATQYPTWYNTHNMGPVISQDYKRGYLKSVEVYSTSSTEPIKKTEYKYTEDTRNSYNVLGFWSKNIFNYTTSCAPPLIFSTAYHINSRWYYKSEETITAKDGTIPIVTTVKYDYDVDNKNHFQLSTSTQTDSKNKQVVTRYKYPLDYPQNTLFNEMFSRYLNSPLVEQITTRGGNVVSASKNEYALENNDIHLKRIHAAEISSAVPINNFNDGYYQEKVSYQYDDYDNVTAITQKDGITTAYVYGYKQTLPIAEVKNALPTEVFYTSFEENGSDDNQAKTGSKSWASGSYTIPFTPPTGKSYWLSYWSWSVNKWNFRRIPFQTAINEGEKLDEISVYPQGAQVRATYTHEPLVGLTSQTNAEHTTTYFEYDGLQRLWYIKDQNKSIIKNYAYNYVYTPGLYESIWTDTGNKRCIVGTNGPTGYQEKEQRDSNPLSTTYNQTKWVNGNYNITACPTCSENSKKWINGQCETGRYVYDTTEQVKPGECQDLYHYEFSDGSRKPATGSYRKTPGPC